MKCLLNYVQFRNYVQFNFNRLIHFVNCMGLSDLVCKNVTTCYIYVNLP